MKFYDAYQELEQIAKDMQDDPEKVIDVMEEKLKRAIELNKLCNDRLNNVQAMLDEYKKSVNIQETKPNISEDVAEQTTTEEIPF